VIIIRGRRNLTESNRRKTWFDYILDHLNSDVAFDLLANIFDGYPYAEGPHLIQAISELRKLLPSVPKEEIKDYVRMWVEHHEGILKH
jgi:hypothetical protein